jgi:nucleoside 2-deoxyribosyltransferase
MNVLNKTKVYLAGNLENAISNTNTWRDYVKNELSSLNITFLSPLERMFTDDMPEDESTQRTVKMLRANGEFDVVHEHMKKIIRKDLRLVDVSDFFIFNFDIKTPTYGTMHELVLASQQRKPVFISVGDKRQCPLWIMGLFNHKYIYNNVEEIVDVLKRIDSGEIEINNGRWRLLKQEFR